MSISTVPGGRENRCVYSARVKAFCDSTGARSAGGRLFKVVGPLTAKLRCPTAVRTRGTSMEFDWMKSSSFVHQTWR